MARETLTRFLPNFGDVIDVTLSLDTATYADGDVLAATQVVTDAVRTAGGRARLESLFVLDESDQGAAFDLLILDSNVSIGTENAAVSVVDADARSILARIPIASGDYYDMGGCRIASLGNLGKMLRAVSGSRDLYVAAVSRGTGTYAAAGIRLKLGLSSS
jgi:hypothetical protein